MESISAYLNDLGAAVVLPVLIAVFAMALGQKFSRSVRSGILIGSGSISTIAPLLSGKQGSRSVRESGFEFCLWRSE